MTLVTDVQVAKRTGAVIEVIPETADSDVDIEALGSSILRGDRRPALLAFTHIPTNSGLLHSKTPIHSMPSSISECLTQTCLCKQISTPAPSSG